VFNYKGDIMSFDLGGMLGESADEMLARLMGENKDLSYTDALDLIKMKELGTQNTLSAFGTGLQGIGTIESLYSKYFGQGKDMFDEQMATMQQNRDFNKQARQDRTDFLGGTKSAFAQ